MKVKELHSAIVQNFTSFFEDFNYLKRQSENIFYQQGKECNKLIFLNITDYQDGLMVECILGISQPTVEHQLSELLGKSNHHIQQLTFYLYLESIDSSLPKRSFLNSSESIKNYIKQIESFFIHAGFYWLDEYGHTKKLSDLLALSMIKQNFTHLNMSMSALRSLLLKQQLGEKITEDLFFTFLELMQEKGLPEQEIAQYAQFRKYFIPR